MDQQISFGVEADKSTIDGVNSLNLDSDGQPLLPQVNGISESYMKSIPIHAFNRGNFIIHPGQPPVMPFKKNCNPHLKHDGTALSYGGKKRRENGRHFRPCKNVPWVKRSYHPSFSGLHEEIEDFYEYMKPTENERCMRSYAIQSVKQVVHQLWPNAEVDVFGSFRTDLYLPTSDIDMVVFGKWDSLPMGPLKEELIKKGVAKEDTVKVLDRASVPIIKFQHIETKVKVDISFNMNSGVRSVNLVKDFLKKFPSLPKLMFVLKQFLLFHDLNEVWTGGLSSYSLLLMCVSFLQLHPRCDPTQPNNNLGSLLQEFFDLYGRCFNYEATCIRVKNGGCYITKEEFCQQLDNGSAPSILCIEDPLTRGNDLGKGSYAMLRIRQIFNAASQVILKFQNRQDRNCECCFLRVFKERNSAYCICDVPFSGLGRLMRVPDGVIDYRQNISDRWRTFLFPTAVAFSELPRDVRCSTGSLSCDVASSMDLNHAGPLGTSEGYSSSSSSTESDLDESRFYPSKPIYRARSCESIPPSTRKLRTVQIRQAFRLHSADNRETIHCKYNYVSPGHLFRFPADQSSCFRGAGESVNEQFANGKAPCDLQYHSRLISDDNNRLENRGDGRFGNGRASTNSSPPTIRGRPTTARGHSSAVNRKYTIQRPVSVGSGRWLER